LRFPLRDSKRIGKFAADVGARREALDMYPRERRKQADAAKSPTLFERNAWHICPVNGTMPVKTKEFVLLGRSMPASGGCRIGDVASGMDKPGLMIYT